MLLSLVLHPQYHLTLFNNNIRNLSYTHFGQWINYYFQVWFDTLPQYILREYLSYQREAYPFDIATFNQFGGNIMDFWDSAKGQAPELSRFALHLYGICVNSASVERLWSTMGFLHSKRQNQLHVSKIQVVYFFKEYCINY